MPMSVKLINSSHKRLLKMTAELSVVSRVCKHFEVVIAAATMKSSILQVIHLNHPTNVYINKYLTQKRTALLYKLRIIEKDNSVFGSVNTRNG